MSTGHTAALDNILGCVTCRFMFCWYRSCWLSVVLIGHRQAVQLCVPPFGRSLVVSMQAVLTVVFSAKHRGAESRSETFLIWRRFARHACRSLLRALATYHSALLDIIHRRKTAYLLQETLRAVLGNNDNAAFHLRPFPAERHFWGTKPAGMAELPHR